MESLKHFGLDLRIEIAKMLNKMKTAFEDCTVGAHYEAANCVVILPSHRDGGRRVDLGAVQALDTVSVEKNMSKGLVIVIKRREWFPSV